MHTRLAIIATTAVIGAPAGYLTLTANRHAGQVKKTADIGVNHEDSVSQHVSSSPQAPPKGAYVNYADTSLAAHSGTKLLFFHAGWCSQCQKIEASIQRQGLPDGVSVIKVDYDTEAKLRAKYQVTQQTTFVRVNDKGELLRKFVAYREPSIDAVLRELL